MRLYFTFFYITWQDRWTQVPEFLSLMRAFVIALFMISGMLSFLVGIITVIAEWWPYWLIFAVGGAVLGLISLHIETLARLRYHWAHRENLVHRCTSECP